MNPKNEPLRLQSAEKLFERIERDSKIYVPGAGQGEMRSRFLYGKRPHKPGWTPVPDYRVVAKADVYKGRDIESLMRYHQAHKRDIGYWEDAPRGEPFTGVGNGSCPTRDATASKQGVAPLAPTLSSSSDPYEPVGTVPIVGDRVVRVKDDKYTWCAKIGEVFDIVAPRFDKCYSFGRMGKNEGELEDRDFGTWRILKRQKAPQAQAAQGLKVRAWRSDSWECVRVDDTRHFFRMRCIGEAWAVVSRNASPSDDERLDMVYHGRLPAQEALELWKSCATALRLNVETGEAQSATVALDGSRAGKED